MKDPRGSETLESMSQAIWYNQWTLNKFRKYLRGNILEVGCGIGNFTDALIGFGKVWAVDVNKEYVAQTRQKVNGKAQVGLGDIENNKYFFRDQKFDSIVCLNVLEHIQDDKETIKNMQELLKTDGYLILLIPAHNFLYGAIDKSIGHFRRYAKSQIRNALEDIGFKIIKCQMINFLGGIGWWISSKLFSEAQVSENKIKVFNFIAPMILPLEDIIEPPIGTSILIVAKK